jgi:hypothetical protein
MSLSKKKYIYIQRSKEEKRRAAKNDNFNVKQMMMKNNMKARRGVLIINFFIHSLGNVVVFLS